MNAFLGRMFVVCASVLATLSIAAHSRAAAADPAAGVALTTAELQQYLWDRVYGGKKWEWEIDDFKTAAQFSIQGQDGKTPAETLRETGGYFGVRVVDLPGSPVVYDNKMSYLWSRKPSLTSHERNLAEKRGHRLSPDKSFAHIIPQRVGLDQPEMRRFMKEGDILVYWHPEWRNYNLDQLREWRATHAATIIEMKVRAPDAGGREATNTVLATVDTPAGYARPFDGADSSVFHVFRFVPRAKTADGGLEQGEALAEGIADAHRAQIARWATLGYDKFNFNSTYSSMTFRRAEQLDDYVKSYLATPAEIAAGHAKPVEEMYCAWFAYMNLNLGATRPINAAGLPSPLGRFSWESLAAPSRSLTFKKETHRYGQGRLADYQAPDDLARRSLVFSPFTAPEMVMNYLDRYVGPNRLATADEARWKRHASFKAKLLEQMKPKLIQGLQVNPDDRGFDARQTSAADAREFNQEMERVFTEAIAGYQQAANREYANLDAVLADERSSRKKNREILNAARRPDAPGRRWIPPYAFAAEAECMSQFLGDETEPVYNSELVYVGTVVPDRFLKKSGEGDSQQIMPIQATSSLSWDKSYYGDRKIASALGVSSSGALEALWRRLTEEDDPRCGFNQYETLVLKAMRNAWIKQLPSDPEVRATPEWQKKIAQHNQFGIDDVLLRRLLIAQWNDPAKVRPCLYGQDRYTIAGGVENIRTLFSYHNEDDFLKTLKSRAEHERNDAMQVVSFPRFTKVPRCGGGVEKTPTRDDPGCRANP